MFRAGRMSRRRAQRVGEMSQVGVEGVAPERQAGELSLADDRDEPGGFEAFDVV